MRTIGLQCLLISFLYILMCRGNICCPKQLEGFIQVSSYNNGSSFDKAIFYMIDHGTCYKGSSGPLPQTAFCIPDDSTLSKDYRLGPSLLVSEYTFADEKFYVANISRTITKECMPIVEEQIYTRNDNIFVESRFLIYEDVTLEIKDPSVFDLPAICKQSILMNRMKYRQLPFRGRFTKLF